MSCVPQDPSSQQYYPSIPLYHDMNCCTKIPEGADKSAYEAAASEAARVFIDNCMGWPDRYDPVDLEVDEESNNRCGKTGSHGTEGACVTKFFPWFASCLYPTAQDTSTLFHGQNIPEENLDAYRARFLSDIRQHADRYNRPLPEVDIQGNAFEDDLHGLTECVNYYYDNSCTYGANNQPCENSGYAVGRKERDTCRCECVGGYTGDNCEIPPVEWNRETRIPPPNDCATGERDRLVTPESCFEFWNNYVGTCRDKYHPYSSLYSHDDSCTRDQCCRSVLAEFVDNCANMNWIPYNNHHNSSTFRDQSAANDMIRTLRTNCRV